MIRRWSLIALRAPFYALAFLLFAVCGILLTPVFWFIARYFPRPINSTGSNPPH